VKDTFDAIENLDGGVRYLKYLLTVFGEDDRGWLWRPITRAKARSMSTGAFRPIRRRSDTSSGWVGVRRGEAGGAGRAVPKETAAVPEHPAIEQFVDTEGRLHVRTRPSHETVIWALPIALLAAGLGLDRPHHRRALWSVGRGDSDAIETDGETAITPSGWITRTACSSTCKERAPRQRTGDDSGGGPPVEADSHRADPAGVTRVVLDLASPIEYSVLASEQSGPHHGGACA